MSTKSHHIDSMGDPPQDKPGSEAEMGGAPGSDHREPISLPDDYQAAGKLAGKKALITGGDSGIGRSVAVMFAAEGADVAIIYRSSDEDAQITKQMVEKLGRQCVLCKADVGDEPQAAAAVKKAIDGLGGLNVLVNNAAEQHPQKQITDITAQQLEATFRSNIFGYFHVAKAAVPHLTEGDSVINTCSVTAFKGMPVLLDYSSTKGAIVAFTRSLAENLKEKKIRVNSVAPGPVWTPLIPSTFPEDKTKKFGDSTMWGRPAEPWEIATSYVFLAGPDGAFFSGQTLHPNGGTVVAG
jgi:NAD(P)-dependent dehydrogenase (short-subunit alcohol dehydrogenase family)